MSLLDDVMLGNVVAYGIFTCERALGDIDEAGTLQQRPRPSEGSERVRRVSRCLVGWATYGTSLVTDGSRTGSGLNPSMIRS
jgi:hypothetical protein